LLVFPVFLPCIYVHGEDSTTVSKAAVNDFIGLTELNTIDRVYGAILKNKIKQKVRDNCNGSPECAKKWAGIEKQLFLEESAQTKKSRERMVQILTARYSKDQLAWLVKTYNTPLLKDFRKFANSDESAAPVTDIMNFLTEKIKQADTVAAKPVGNK